MENYFKPRAVAKRSAPIVEKTVKKVRFNRNTNFERKLPVYNDLSKTYGSIAKVDSSLELQHLASSKIKNAYRVGNLGYKPERSWYSRSTYPVPTPSVPFKTAYSIPKVDRKQFVTRIKSKRFLDDLAKYEDAKYAD